ncbi:MAG: hypothetical protein E6772_14435 [Dysgonomonas sp.]|nr:hypothetical protein [Dysgonomonas sp.]
MNRDLQIKKIMENKQVQAQQEYAKNKPEYVENKIEEKATEYIQHSTEKEIDNKAEEDMNKNRASE